MSAWPIIEAALHRWIRESTGISATSVTWPENGRPLPEPPAASMSVLGQRDFTMPGKPEIRSAQNVSWSVTVTAGPGTHAIDVLIPGTDTPAASTEVTMPGGTSVEDARDALLAQATIDLADLDLAASGTDAITITGTEDLRVFHLDVSASLSLELLAGPQQVLRATPSQVVVSIEFRSAVTAGDGTARILANKAKDAMRDYERMLNRCGVRFGALLRDTPSYLADLTESRHVLDIQLLGHRVAERPPKPWVRKSRTILAAASITSTVTSPE